MSTSLEVRLLGEFAVVRNGVPLERLNTPRLQALMAYLLLHRDTQLLRRQLAFAFWPDSSEAQAQNNLRQLLHALRGAWPDAESYITIESRTLHWRRGVSLQFDVDVFSELVHTIDDTDPERAPDTLRDAGALLLALYHGDLLPGCYDEWIVPERERLRDAFLQSLEQLIRQSEARHDYVTAIHYARRLVRTDPINEGAHRALMRLLVLAGDESGELVAFRECVALLRRELGIAPGQATLALHQQLQLQRAQFQQTRPIQNGRGAQPQVSLPNAEPARSVWPTSPRPSLIGRQREWDMLRRAWALAQKHGPSCVVITGEAGIGKTRLAAEAVYWATQQQCSAATTRSYAIEGQLALAPVTGWLHSEALWPHAEQIDPAWLTEIARMLPEVYLKHPTLPHYGPLTEPGQRQRFFQALARAVLAAPQPLLLVIDDLQWCDTETLEWLHFLLHFDPKARLLVIGNVRTEEIPAQHPLHRLLLALRHTVPLTEIALQPLDASETARLAAKMVHHELDAPTASRLFSETEGNPLFVIETVRAGLETALPASIRAVITGRLAQLSPSAREVAHIAALIGREFTLDLIVHVSGSDEQSVVHALNELWQRRIVREQGPASYDFTHDKLREVARYEISAPQRHLWHRRIARSLAALHADHLDPFSGQIAVHYEQGGEAHLAIAYYQRAAQVAQHVFAHNDAIELLRHSLLLLDQMPASEARDREELELQLAIEPLYRVMHGWTAPELQHVVNRTLALCATVGNDAQHAEALYGQQSLLLVQAQFARVERVADQLHALYARASAAPPPHADMMLAGAQFHTGRLQEADQSFRRILDTSQGAEHDHQLLDVQGWDAAIHTRAWQAHVLWCVGRPADAFQMGQQAMQLAEHFEAQFNQALAATYLAMLEQMSSHGQAALTSAYKALTLATEFHAPYYRTWAAILVAYAEACAQPTAAHITTLRHAIDDFAAFGAQLRLPYYLSLLAEVYAHAGQADAGLATINAAFAQAKKAGEHWWDAELHRIRGELLLAAGHAKDEAASALREAITVARSAHARALELRAYLTLCRMTDRPDAEASLVALRDVFAQIDTGHEVGHATGYETPDLQAARSLLNQSP